ncbi:MAG: homing endonuclease associated repeat-containing protein [Cetobacterium sp.]
MKKNSHKKFLRMNDSDLLEVLKDFILLNGCLTTTLYRSSKFITFDTLKRRFKLHIWKELITLLDLEKEYDDLIALRAAATKPRKFKKTKVTETPEELLELYKSFSEKIGATNGATISELKKHRFKYSDRVLLARFGSWKSLKESAGFTSSSIPKYSKDEIIALMLDAREKQGRRLSQNEITKNKNLPALVTIYNCFRSTKISDIWDELEVGIEKTTTAQKSYSLEEIKALLYVEYLKKGSHLTAKELASKFREGVFPGRSTIYRHFKTFKIKEVWEIVLS